MIIFKKKIIKNEDIDNANRPGKKDPVISLKKPTIKGPKKPPISPTAKKSPITPPIFFIPISGISINVTSKIGIKPPSAKPSMKIGNITKKSLMK